MNTNPKPESPLTTLHKKANADMRSLGHGVLFALQLMNTYAGTVPEEVVQERRRKNRAARQARRGNAAALRRQARSNRARNSIQRFARGQAPSPLGDAS